MIPPPTTSAAPSRLPALLLAIVTCLLACLSLSPDPASGVSATLLARHGGFDATPTPLYPIWTALLLLLRQIPFSTFAYRAGLLSAVSAAACVYLLVRLLQHGPRAYITPGRAPHATVFCAVPAVLYLLLSLPFEVAADHAHPILLHIAFVLASIRGIQRFTRESGIVPLLVASFLAGFALPEWWAVAILSPVLFAYAWNACQRRSLDVPYSALFMVIAWLLGVLASLITLRMVFLVAGHQATVLPDFLPALSEMLQLQLQVLRADSSALTWCAFLLAGVLPVALVLYCANQMEIDSPPEWIILHGIFTALPLCVLGVAAWSPLPLPSPFSSLLQLLVILSAILLGYACVFWYALIDELPDRSPPLLSSPCISLLAAIFLILSGIPMRQFPRQDLRADRIVNAWAHYTLLPLDDDAVIVGSGPLLHHLILRSHQAGRTHHFVDEDRYREQRYLHNLHSIPESTPLMILAYRSHRAFRSALLTDPKTSSSTYAFLEPPPFEDVPWAPLTPTCGLYLVRPPTDVNPPVPDPDDTWNALADSLPSAPSTPSFPSLLDPLDQLRTRTARLANDLALVAAGQDNPGRAVRLLSAAVRLDPDNRTPPINRTLLSAAAGQLSNDDQDWQECQDLLCSGRLRFQSIGGYDPDSGRLLHPARIALLQRALPPSLQVLPDTTSAREAITRFLIDDPNAPEAARVCSRSPANLPVAGVLIALNAVLQNNAESVASGIALMESADLNPVPLLLAAAEWYRDQGDLEATALYLYQATERDAADLEVLEAETIFQLVGTPTAKGQEYGRRLVSLEPGNPYGRLFLASEHIQRKNPELAAEILVPSMNSQRLPALTLQLARLLLEIGRQNEAITTARDAVALRSASPGYWNALADLCGQLNQRELSRFAAQRTALLQSIDVDRPDFSGILLARLANPDAGPTAPAPKPPTPTASTPDSPEPPSMDTPPPTAEPAPTTAPPRVDIEDEDIAAPVPLGW